MEAPHTPWARRSRRRRPRGRPVRRSGQTTTACYRRAVPCAICRSRPGSRRGASVDPAFCNSKNPGGVEPRDLLEAGSEQLSVRLNV